MRVLGVQLKVVEIKIWLSPTFSVERFLQVTTVVLSPLAPTLGLLAASASLQALAER